MANSQHSYQLRKTKMYQGLKDVPIYLFDNSDYSPNYFNISYLPSELTAGKNIIKLKGNNNNLKIDSKVLFECVDGNNNTIYSETHNYHDRYGNYFITLYIYPETPPGFIRLTLLGIATVDAINKTQIPSQWINKPNIKWEKFITVDPLKRNSSEIILKSEPTIAVNEVFKTQNIYNYAAGKIINYASATFEKVSYKCPPNITQKATNYASEQSKYTQYSEGIIPTINTTYQEVKNSEVPDTKTLPKDKKQNPYSIESRHGASYKDDSAPTLQLNKTVSFAFEKVMEGGIIKIDTPLNPFPNQNLNFIDSSDQAYTATIVKVLDSGRIQVDKPYSRKIQLDNRRNAEFNFQSFEHTQFEITYSGDYSISGSQAYKNFAEVTITNLETLSGDVFKIKPYVKSVTDNSDYVPMTDIIIDTRNILLNPITLADESIGDFKTQTLIDTYWSASNYSNVSTIAPTQNNGNLINGCRIVTDVPQTSGYIKFEHTPDTKLNLYKGNLYRLSLNTYSLTNSSALPEIEIGRAHV